MYNQRKKLSKARRHETLVAYSFLFPNILGFLCVTIFPIIASLYLSFTDYSMGTEMRWLGLQNYINLLNGSDKNFGMVMWNTLYYTVGAVPFQMVLAILIATLLNQQIKGRAFFRVCVFMPVVASTVASALLWKWLYAKDFGLISVFLQQLGIKSPYFLQDPHWAMPAVIVYAIWKSLGYNCVLFLAGLQSVPDSYEEAARIDGASSWQIYTKITLPLLTPTIFFVLIMSIISSFQVFDHTYILTEGGPAYATTTIVYYLYLNGFKWFEMGYASSMAWILFIMIMLLTVIQWTIQGKWVNYDID